MDTTTENTMPEATAPVSAPVSAPAKAPRKATAKPGKAKVAATGKGKGKGKVAEAPAARVNHVAQVQARVGKRRIVWGGKPLDWPKAAKESGKRAEALLKAAGPKGMTYAEYAGEAGSINRLGYMLRKEAAKLA